MRGGGGAVATPSITASAWAGVRVRVRVRDLGRVTAGVCPSLNGYAEPRLRGKGAAIAQAGRDIALAGAYLRAPPIWSPGPRKALTALPRALA